MKYKVEYNVSPHKGTLEVEADSEEDAINKAMLILRKRLSAPDASHIHADKFKIIS